MKNAVLTVEDSMGRKQFFPQIIGDTDAVLGNQLGHAQVVSIHDTYAQAQDACQDEQKYWEEYNSKIS